MESPFSKLEGSYWYVPVRYLPAMQFDPKTGESVPVIDQTVWYFSKFRDGYVQGKSYVMLKTKDGGIQYTPARYIVGTITPWGGVMLTFIQEGSATGSPTTVTGTGRFVNEDGKWLFQMQMASGLETTTVHWAEMWQTHEGDPSWSNLPGTGGQSMEEFLGNF